MFNNAYRMCGVAMLSVAAVFATGGAVAEAPVRIGRAVRFPAPPQLDGELEPECRLQTPALDGFTRVIHGSGPAEAQTRGFLGYDETNLYAGIVCLEPRADVLARRAAEGTLGSSGESVELFVDPGGDGVYYQFIVGASGDRWEGRQLDPEWTAPWDAAVGLTAQGYVVEISVPFESLGARPDTGSLWRVNVTRSRGLGDQGELSCWSNTEGGFHAPHRFGYLVFGDFADYFQTRLKSSTAAAAARIKALREQYPGPTAALGPVEREIDGAIAGLQGRLREHTIRSEAEAAAIVEACRELDRRLEAATARAYLAVIRNEFKP